MRGDEESLMCGVHKTTTTTTCPSLFAALMTTEGCVCVSNCFISEFLGYHDTLSKTKTQVAPEQKLQRGEHTGCGVVFVEKPVFCRVPLISDDISCSFYDEVQS